MMCRMRRTSPGHSTMHNPYSVRILWDCSFVFFVFSFDLIININIKLQSYTVCMNANRNFKLNL